MVLISKNKIFSNSIINQDIINRAYNIKNKFKERKELLILKLRSIHGKDCMIKWCT